MKRRNAKFLASAAGSLAIGALALLLAAPIRFEEDLKVTIQALAWSKNAAGQSA